MHEGRPDHPKKDQVASKPETVLTHITSDGARLGLRDGRAPLGPRGGWPARAPQISPGRRLSLPGPQFLIDAGLRRSTLT